MAGPRVALITQFGILLSTFFLVPFVSCETFAASMILSESETKSATTGTVEELLAEGRRHQEAGQIEKAIEKYQAALTRVHSTQDTHKIATLYTLLGESYAQLGRWQAAITAYKQAIRVWPDDVEAYNDLGAAYYEIGRFLEAIVAYKQALRLGPNDAKAYRGLGEVYDEIGRFPDAMKAYKQALGLKPDEAETYNDLGVTYDKIGRYQDAAAAYKEAIRLKPDYAEAYYGLGGMLQVFGQFAEALLLYQQQQEVARERKDPELGAAALVDLAEMSDHLGDASRAQDYARQALDLYQNVKPKPSEEAYTFEDIGRAHQYLGQYEQALSSYQQALSRYQETKDYRGMGEMLVRIGEILTSIGNYEQAIPWLREALHVHQQFFHSRAFPAERVIDLELLGRAYSHLGRYDEALKAFQEAHTIAHRLHWHYKSYEILANIGSVREEQGKLREALALYIQAIEALETVGLRQHLEEVSLPLREKAFSVYQRAVGLLFKIHAGEPKEHYAGQAFLYHEKGKARTLLDLLEEAKVRVRVGINPALLKEEDNISARISHLHRALADRGLTKDQEKQFLAMLAEQEQAWQALRVKIAVASPKYAELTSPHIAGIQQVQAILDKETLLLEYASGEEKSFLWGVTRDGMQAYELPAEEVIARQIEQYLPTLRAPLYGKDEIGRHIDLGRELYQTLLQPAARQLQGKSKLIIVPDGNLYYLPFETLITDLGGSSDDKKSNEPSMLQAVPYLAKEYTVTYSPSASVLVTLEKEKNRNTSHRKEAPQASLLAFGDPVYEAAPAPQTVALTVRGAYEERGGGFQRLAYSAQEVKRIAGVYGITLPSDAVNLEENATEKHLHEVDLTHYRILHFATHAIVGDEVKWITQPALVLSLAGTDDTYDGFLQMSEIFNLRLDADLVVLSACDTGRGKLRRGEGIIGLTRAFMYAGTPSVVASLWKVNDQSTSLFMEFFYRNLKDGQSKAAALRQAKKQLMQTQAWSDTVGEEQSFAVPYFWAPFILIGSGN